MIPIALCLIGALDDGAIAIHLEQSKDISSAIVTASLGALREGIAARTNRRVITDEVLWSECPTNDRCLLEIETRLGTPDVVIVRLLGGPSLFRIIAERYRRDVRVAEAVLELPSDSPDLAARTSALASRLFSEAAHERRVRDITLEDSTPSRWPKWVLLVSSATMIGVGTAFVFDEGSARGMLDRATVLDRATYDAIQARRDRDGRAALGLLGGGVTIAIAALVWMLVE